MTFKKDCIHCIACHSGAYFCKLEYEMDEEMKCVKCKHYHKPMIFYVEKLPCSCAECDCPFNYDTSTCMASDFAEGGSYKDMDDELRECLRGNGKRYSKCPLKLIKELKE